MGIAYALSKPGAALTGAEKFVVIVTASQPGVGLESEASRKAT
jgi:hypothetical protein